MADYRMKKEIQEIMIQIEQYKQYRTLVPLQDSEIPKYTLRESTECVLDREYKEILFGEKDGEERKEWQEKIIEIRFSDVILNDMEARAAESGICCDISEEKDGAVIGWIEKVNSAEYILHIDGDRKIYAPVDCTELFSGFSQVRKIDFRDAFDTSRVTNAHGMFYHCLNLPALDVSEFDTRNVTDMGYMFFACQNLRTLDVSGFDTRNVTNMRYMFYGCYGLRKLDVSGFHTQNVTDMACMFYGCDGLKTLDVRGFDTRNVTDMYHMFCGCRVETLDVSRFDTRNVINMGSMFCNCKNLKTLDVSGFDTRRVTKIDYMFYGCEQLKTLDVSGFDLQKVLSEKGEKAGFGSMFTGCSDTLSAGIKLFEIKQYKDAVPFLEKAAVQGHAAAQYLLGTCYAQGLTVDIDPEKAFTWYEKAAVQGQAEAQVQLGDCYYEGIGTEQNYEKAYEWYQKAAEQGAAVDRNKMDDARKKSRKGVFGTLKNWLKG